MNWYKKAKLADKEPDPNKNIHTTCQYCNRWVTEDKPNIWKKQEDLDPEENDQRMNAENGMMGYRSEIGVSHGICPYCFETMQKIGFPKNRADINTIKEVSLSLN